MTRVTWTGAALVAVSLAGAVPGGAQIIPFAMLSPAAKCEATKLKRAGLYNACRMKAQAKAVKSGKPVDFSKCDATFADKWALAETDGGMACPTSGDLSAVQSQVASDTALIITRLKGGTRFVDNGDGTISDLQTGLMWEKKDNLDGTANLSDPHDADNVYKWSSTGTAAADGPAFTDFLSRLNTCTSLDGMTITGGLGGHCDWRLPTIVELQTIVDLTATGCGTGNPCIFSELGPTVASYYWSSTGDPGDAWYVYFFDGSVNFNDETVELSVRAVRGVP